MFNLYEILQNAQGGQALDNLATQFHVSRDEADAAVKALMPALSAGFLKRASEPEALGSIIRSLGENQHLAAFADPGAAQSASTAQRGADVLSHIFGSNEVSAQVAERAAALSGVKPELLRQMLPVIASMIIGGIKTALHNQGLGGVFGQLANAAGQGGLGSILGELLGGGANPSNPRPPQGSGPSASTVGGFASILGTILGNLFARPGSAPTPPLGAPSSAPGFDAASIQAALEALTKMLQPGTPPRTGQEAGIENEIGQILDGKRR